MTKTNSKTKTNNYLIVYKMKLAMALMEKGYSPLYTMPNPKNTTLICWVFQKTDAFLKDFEELVKEGV